MPCQYIFIFIDNDRLFKAKFFNTHRYFFYARDIISWVSVVWIYFIKCQVNNFQFSHWVHPKSYNVSLKISRNSITISSRSTLVRLIDDTPRSENITQIKNNKNKSKLKQSMCTTEARNICLVVAVQFVLLEIGNILHKLLYHIS